MIDSFIQCIIEGNPSPAWTGTEMMAVIEGYKQEEEKEFKDEKDEWHPVALPKSFVRLF